MLLAITVFLAAVATPVDSPASAIPRMGAQELHSMLESGEAIAIDVRGSVPYELGHIERAVWLPFGLIGQRAADLPKDKLIVAYCTCSKEQVSLEVLAELQKIGFSHVAALQGGYPAWVEAGLPTVSNRAPQPVAVESAPEQGSTVESRGRLAPPAAVSCDRNELTSYVGKIKSYKRQRGKTVLVMNTSADTTERLTIQHSTDDPSRFFLINGTVFTSRDWNRIERKKGQLLPDMSAVAWVCSDGRTYIDWRPGTTFSGAE